MPWQLPVLQEALAALREHNASDTALAPDAVAAYGVIGQWPSGEFQQRAGQFPMKFGTALLTLAIAALSVQAVAAETVEEFYRGKQVHMIIGHPAGGDYDLGGRLLAKYLLKYIPGNPAIVVQNMPGGAGIVAANYLYKVAPKDGTVFGSFSRNLPSQAVLGLANIEADPRRFAWLGATALPSRICVDREASAVKSADDLFTHELITAGTGAGSSGSIVPTVLNRVLGTKFRIVEGYQGTPDALLAVERGEVDGVCNSYATFRSSIDQIKSGKIRVLFRAEEAPLVEMPEVPSIYRYAKTEAQRQFMRFIFSSVEFGRPYVMPPETPGDRVQAMRKAFVDALNDPELVAEARQLDIDMTFRPAEAVADLVEKLYGTPPRMLDEVRKLVPDER
jgi:tripartite-type tricarboxylate transporter receptor subunit TctC